MPPFVRSIIQPTTKPRVESVACPIHPSHFPFATGTNPIPDSNSSTSTYPTAVMRFLVTTSDSGITAIVSPTSLAMDPLPLIGDSGGKTNIGIIVGSTIGGALLGILIGIGLWFCFCQRRGTNRNRKQNVPMQSAAPPDYATVPESAPPTHVDMQPRLIPASSSLNNVRVTQWLERMNSQQGAGSTRPQRKDTRHSDTTLDSASMYSQSTYYSQNPNPFGSASTLVLAAPAASYSGLPMVEETDERRDTGQGSRNSRASR
ncbi:hypothetical protein WG66_009808 [Moniliophthora roreri]|nr:hypothetical protein WG66_009808 [Moniliophthora roreri]